MTINTTAGKTYAVTPKTDCTVSTPEGVLIASCPAGEQTLFVSPATEIEVSDDAALVTESFKGAPAGSSAAGGVRVIYEHITQTPAEGNLSNVNTYGFAIVTTQSGRLDSIALAPRTSGGVADHWPMYLKIWVADGDRWNVLGTSLNAVAQVAGGPSVWRFAGINLEAGRKIQIEARKNPESTIHDSRLSVSVVANTLADTGCIDAQGRLSMTDWVPQYTLSLSRETGIGYRGIQLAEQAALDAHTHDAVRHITADERTEWNNKADASALSGKVNTATFNSHTGNSTLHVTAEERAAWNAKQDSIVDENGVATVFRCAIYEEAYSLFAVLTGSAVWQNRASGVFELRGDDAYSMGVTLSLGRSNGEPARLVKQNQKAPLSPTDVPNRAEGNTCWVKFRIDMTDAQYEEAASAGTLDTTTLYVTSDGGKVYMGSHALN